MDILFILGIEFLLLLPLIIVYGIQEKKNRIRHIIVTFSAPNGQQKAMPVKIGFSWTIFFFKGWALLFRGQFMEWLIMFFVGSLLSSMAGYSLVSAGAVFDGGLLTNPSAVGIWGWIGFTAFILMNTALSYYYILFGNKIRLRSLYRRGFTFDNGQNEDVQDIYDYIGEQPRGSVNQPLKPGVVQGQSHQYVVPDEQVTEPEENYDYSTLTVQDLKLLLKSEGIAFDATSTKEELLELVEEHIAKDQRAEAEKEKKQYSDSKYFVMTVQELVEELDKRKIEYTSTMKKADLVKLLVDADNKK